MGTYRVPRNTKGESRILLIFSTKAMIYTVVGIGIGLPFKLVFDFVGVQYAGIIIMAILGLIGFSVATFKIPAINGFPVTKEVAGEQIDDIIVRYFKFRRASKKIYVSEKIEKQTKEEKENAK